MSADSVLGWGLKKIREGEALRAIKQAENYSIIELDNGGRMLLIDAIRMPEEQEALLFRNALLEFQAGAMKGEKQQIYSFMKEYCIGNVVVLSREQKQLLLELLERTVKGFGAMDFLLECEDIEEVSVIGLGKQKPVFVFHRQFGWLETNLYYCSETTVKDLVNKMARELERRLTLYSPRLNAMLPDGSRLSASIFPVSFLGPNFTVRKFTKQPFSPAELVRNRTACFESMAFLWLAMELDCSVMIAGNTGSGKTSTLNSLFCFVPKNERIVCVEETPEIVLPHSHVVKLGVVEELGIGMNSLITDTLRMRPDRVIVGEVRTKEEANSLVQTLLAGQGKGSYCTFHSQSAKECISRLKILGIMETDISALDLVVVQRRWNRASETGSLLKEQRRIIEIAEPLDTEQGTELNRVFSFDYNQDCLQKTGESKRVFAKAEIAFLKEKNWIEKELKKRENFLKKAMVKGKSFQEFFGEVNAERKY